MKEEKVKEIKQNAESLKNANGDTAVKIAAEINKNENTTDQTENATDTVDNLNGKKEKGKKTTEEDRTQVQIWYFWMNQICGMNIWIV